jgi:hypothetical protein
MEPQMTEAAKSTHKVSIDLADLMNLLAAATFGAEKAVSFKSDFTIRAWQASIDKFNDMPLSDGRTQVQRDDAHLDSFAGDCAQHGAD